MGYGQPVQAQGPSRLSDGKRAHMSDILSSNMSTMKAGATLDDPTLAFDVVSDTQH